MSSAYDAVIIGSGVMGCSIAFELAQRGWRTLNVDKLADAGAGSTSNSCAIIRTNYSTLDGTALACESAYHWNHWSDYIGAEPPSGLAVFRRTGALVFKTLDDKWIFRVIESMNRLGLEYENLTMDQVRERYPIYNDQKSYAPIRRPEDPEFGKSEGRKLPGALWYPSGGYVNDPKLSTQNVQFAAMSRGARFLFNTRITGVEKENGRVRGVRIGNGDVIDAPVVINAAGPHSFVINRMAGVEEGMKIRTQALRHEVAHVPSPAGFDAEAFGCPTSDRDIGCYSRPETGNHILIGSEDPPCDPQEWVSDPDNYNTALTNQAVVQACRLALRVSDLGIPNRIKGLVDLYDVTDDWGPIYDKSDLAGFYLCIGTSGNQYKSAPVVGKMMARLIEDCEGGRDHDGDPIQFHLEHTDHTIDMAYCSRLREINQDSSFSVLG